MGLTQPSTLSMQDQWVGSGRSGLPDRSYFFIFGPSMCVYTRLQRSEPDGTREDRVTDPPSWRVFLCEQARNRIGVT